MANMRIGGLASGMDIDTIVGDLMKAERLPLDKLFQKKQTYEWQRDAYRDINKQLADFDDYLFNNFSMVSNFDLKSTTSSNSDIVTATSRTGSIDGTMTIKSITQLAKSAAGASTIGISGSSSSTLSDLGMTTNADGKVELSLDVYNENEADKFSTHTFTFDPTAKLSDVINQVNKSSAGVTMFFDEQSKKVSIATKNTGGDTTAGVAEIIENGTNFFSKLNFASNNLADGGQNAVFNLNGLSMERSSNTFTVNNVTFTLKAETATDVSITSSTDVDGMIKKIEEFVNKYNELIASLDGKTKEKRYRDYPPLTDEQKEDMTEKEIELWEEKARSGLLRSDSIISSGLTNMRRDLYSRVDGIGTKIVDTLAEMGITTKNDITQGGKLYIDKDKLRKAIETDSDKVVQTFTQSGKVTKDASGQVTSDTRGIIQRLRESVDDITENIETKAGKATHTNNQYSLGRQLDDVDNRISDFQRRLEDIESRYWRQFTAMEKAVQQANQQSAFLMGQFGG